MQAKQQSEERAHLEAYIRELRAGTEGPKGGSAPTDKWRLPTRAISGEQGRWEEYEKKRKQLGLPVIGSESLFKKIWREHDEIVEYGAKGHPKCDTCGQNIADRAKYEERSDAVSRQKLKKIAEKQAITTLCSFVRAHHDAEHLGERDYAEDWWMKAEHNPAAVTAFSMDAPTETQFDVPVQKRTAYDAVKSLDNARKWSSKITSLMIAGLGILAFVTRDGLGKWAKLVMYSAVLGLAASCRESKRARLTVPRVARQYRWRQQESRDEHLLSVAGAHRCLRRV
eukprot:6679291-Prymnesium_polylepis.1